MINKLIEKLRQGGLDVRMFTTISIDSQEGKKLTRHLHEMERDYIKKSETVPGKSDTPKSDGTAIPDSKKESPTVPVSLDTPKSVCTGAEDSEEMPLTVPVNLDTPKSVCTVINESDAKVHNILDNLIGHYEKCPNYAKGFITDVADALEFDNKTGSRYKTFELPDGNNITVRLGKHNANVSNFHKYDEDNALSIVVSAFPNRKLQGLTSGVHVVEYYYSKKDLESVKDYKPLARILRSLREALGTGVFIDYTGLAKRQEVNPEKWMMQVVPAPPHFYSNALQALERISQQKATPVQWLAMLQKAGGIKAGEDRWTGLSEWLSGSTEKTLARQDIINYLNSNAIRIEETLYVDALTSDKLLEGLQAEFDEYVAMGEEGTGSIYYSDHYQYAFRQMTEIYGPEFRDGFNMDEKGRLSVYRTDAASQVLGIRPANKDRQVYTTDFLTDKKELALYIPDIEQWETEDVIHFGDVGDGRCIGWIRFGETTNTIRYTAEQRQAMLAEMPGSDKWLHQTYDRKYVPEIWYPTTKDEKYPQASISISNGMYRIWGVADMMKFSYPTLDEAVQAYNRHVVPGERTERILVVDEIQSNRHQEGKKYGYLPKGVIAEYDRLQQVSIEKMNAYYDRLREMKKERGWMNAIDEVTEAGWRAEDTVLAERYQAMKEDNYKATMYRRSHEEGITAYKQGKKIPAAPFEKNWHELCMKRMLRYAAENGYDALTWTTGEQQAVRYDLGHVLNAVYAEPYEAQSPDEVDGYDVDLYTNLGKTALYVDRQGIICFGEINDRSMSGVPLEKLVGKELAGRILNAEGPLEIRHCSDNFRFGYEGMEKFYDERLPAFMNKYVKKWGVQVETFDLQELEGLDTVKHGVRITPEMRQSLMLGQPMFMRGTEGELYGFTVGDTVWLTEKGLRPETLVHEYTHVWAAAMRQGNPEGWQSVKDLLRGTPFWNEVLNDLYYFAIRQDEDLVASEVLARISGKENAAKIEGEIRQSFGAGKDAAADRILERIWSALNTFWSWVGKHMFDIGRFSSIEEVTDRVLYDLLDAQRLEHGKVLVTAPPIDNGRITHIHVFNGKGGQPYIRCKVDGVQQMGVPVKKQDSEDIRDPELLHEIARRYFTDKLTRQENLSHAMKR